MLLHGNAKTDEELELAVAKRDRIDRHRQFDDIDRLERIVPSGSRQPCLVRVIPGVQADTHAAVATGHAGSKLACRPPTPVRRSRVSGGSRVLRCDGVHTHVGSQIMDADQLAAAVEPVAELGSFDVYDFGGGLGVRYSFGDEPPTIESYATALIDQARRLIPAQARIIMEPGRSMTARSACTLYRVTTVKRGAAVTHVAVDGEWVTTWRYRSTGNASKLPWLTRPTGSTSSTTGSTGDDGVELVTVVGRHCESGDQLIDGIELNNPVVGDLLAVPVTGAYCHTMSNQYNGARRIPVVFVSGGDARLVVRRDTWADLLARDVLPGEAGDESSSDSSACASCRR